MSCCGKGKIETAGNIAKAYVGIAIESLLKVPAFKYGDTDRRTRLCQECEKSTWLTKTAYFAFIKEHLGEVLLHFEDLTKLPELPKEENAQGKKLFCMICKCCVPAAVRIRSKKCPENKW